MIYIITAVDLGLTALFAILNSKVWGGFAYFVLSLLLLLSLAWGVYLIIKYVKEFRPELQKDYAEFKAEKINKAGITAEEFEENEKIYKKQFNRACLKQKLAKWAVIAFCFAVAISFVAGIVLYK